MIRTVGEELRNKLEYRDAIAGADIVAFNVGANDFDQTVDPAELTDMWTANLGGMLDVVASSARAADCRADGRPEQ